MGLSQTAWVQTQTLPLADVVALGKFFNLFMPQCAHPKPGINPVLAYKVIQRGSGPD